MKSIWRRHPSSVSRSSTGSVRAASQLLHETAERAREEGWPYERFLEVLLEAEVFARDASGARQRIRHAGFPEAIAIEAEDARFAEAIASEDAAALRRGDARANER